MSEEAMLRMDGKTRRGGHAERITNVSRRWAAVFLVMASTLVGTGLLHAATYTWDAGGSPNNDMTNSVNWAGDPVVDFLTGGTHDLVFGSAGSFAQPASGHSVNTITFTRAFTIGSPESGDAIGIGAGGVTMDNSLAGGVLLRWGLNLYANTFFQNNSSYNFISLRGFEASSARSITNNGSGTNWIRLTPNGAGLNNNVTLIQDSPNSKVSLEIGNGPVAGKLEIHNGLVAWIYNGNPANGNIVLGSATAAESDSAMLGFGHNTSLSPGTASGTLTVSQPIVLAGTVGTNTIASGKRTYGGGYAAVNHTINWTGGVTGGNSLYLENVVDANGDDNIQFSTGSINMSGKLIHIGVGTGTCIIDSVIGTNVTEVIQNSVTSKLILGGANAYTGNTEVVAGTLQVTNNASALPSDTSLFIGGGAKLDLGVDVTVATLWIDSVQQDAGTFGSESSTADNKDNTYFAGSNVLTVTAGPIPRGTVLVVH
jgi:autotransporter-associated beta strand protein